jgi:hypothetical protein
MLVPHGVWCNMVFGSTWCLVLHGVWCNMVFGATCCWCYTVFGATWCLVVHSSAMVLFFSTLQIYLVPEHVAITQQGLMLFSLSKVSIKTTGFRREATKTFKKSLIFANIANNSAHCKVLIFTRILFLPFSLTAVSAPYTF